MKGVTSVQRDLAALGLQAPIRVWYELGKRSGAHGVALRSVARLARPARLHVLEVFRPTAPLPAATVRRCLLDAGRIVELGHRAFGTRFPIVGADEWSALVGASGHWPDDRFWWQIDIRSNDRLGDVKWTWELGRHRDLVVLARAAHVDREGPWGQELGQRLRWWFDATPAERGVHWYSNLEISLRVIAWLQIYALAGEVLPPDVVSSMSLHVALARRHLMVDFPYTVSSMRNNHLLGDALGLLAIEQFTGAGEASAVSKMASRAFSRQLRRHMHPDGSMIEDSVSYHRFVLEMLAVRRLMGDRSSAVFSALASSARHLQRLGSLDGSIPQYGDWDEGRVLASSNEDLEVGGSTALGLTLTRQTHEVQRFAESDEVAWYAGSCAGGALRATGVRQTSTPHASGGIQHAVVGDWSVWLKCGTGPSHQHADLLHVSARYRDSWVLVDPGTGTYNGELSTRNAFRTSGAHNGLRTAGEEMFVPHRAFRWLTTANAYEGPIVTTGQAVVLWGVHDAFRRTELGGRHARAVVVTKSGITCIDWRENNEVCDLTVALSPTVTVSDGTVTSQMTDTSWFLDGLTEGRELYGLSEPFAGQHSATYGRWEPSIWIDSTVTKPGPSVWGLGLASHEATGASSSTAAISVDDQELSLEFSARGATLTVLTPIGRQTYSVKERSA